MGLEDIYNGIMSIRQKNQRMYMAKYKLLQRLSMKQLLELYDKYVYIEPASKEAQNDLSILVSAVSGPSRPNTRSKLVEKLIEEMSWDNLKEWAKEHKVKFDDLGV